MAAAVPAVNSQEVLDFFKGIGGQMDNEPDWTLLGEVMLKKMACRTLARVDQLNIAEWDTALMLAGGLMKGFRATYIDERDIKLIEPPGIACKREKKSTTAFHKKKLMVDKGSLTQEIGKDDLEKALASFTIADCNFAKIPTPHVRLAQPQVCGLTDQPY